MDPASLHSASADHGLAEEATRTLGALRDAVRKLVGSSPTPIRRAADLQRALGVDAPLGWQIFRLAIAADPLAAVLYIPRAGSMAKVLRRALEAGFERQPVAATEAAYAAFEALVGRVAGGRGNFDAMIAALGHATAEQIDTRHRGAAFRANTHVWGVRAATDYRAAIWHAGSCPGSEHLAIITGRVGFQQLRARATLSLKRSVVRDEGDAAARPLSPPRLLEEFCSRPVPRIQIVEDVDGPREVIHANGVGAAGAVDFFALEAARDWNDGRPQTCWSLGNFCSTPCEAMVVDMLVPRGWSDPRTVRASVHGDIADPRSVRENAEPFMLPAREAARHLGADLDALHSPDVPRCPDLVRTALRRLEWDAASFDLYRCRVRYPILHSALVLRVSAPE